MSSYAKTFSANSQGLAHALAAGNRLPCRSRSILPVGRRSPICTCAVLGACSQQRRGDGGNSLPFHLLFLVLRRRRLRQHLVEIGGVDLRLAKARVAQNFAKERQVGLDASNEVFVQGPLHAGDGL